MSLINQVLQDLEKRRASGSELGALPNQVRVLPLAERSAGAWRTAGIAGLVALTGFFGWQLINNSQSQPFSLHEQTPALSSVPAPMSSPLPRTGPTSRLSLELANVPVAYATVSAAEAKVQRDVQAPPLQRKTAIVEDRTREKSTSSPPLVTAQVIATAATTNAAPAAATREPVKIAAATIETPKPASVAISPTGSTLAMVDALPQKQAQEAATKLQIDKRAQTLTAQQLAENEYREAANLLEQGRLADAQEAFRRALLHYPAHEGARQGLYGLLAAAKKYGEAEQILHDGIRLNPNQLVFAMALSGLQYERGDIAAAIETLQKSAPAALRSPDYLARLAGLLQRQSRHAEAAERYQAALRLAPDSGVWLMGLGISLQALGRNKEAQEVFRRARTSNSLNPELQAFVDVRLKQLQ